MYSWRSRQVEHLTKHEVDAVEVVQQDQVAAVASIDVDDDIIDGHASATLVVE
jgi:hypothetical protein